MKQKEERHVGIINFKPKSKGPVKPKKTHELFASLSQEVESRHKSLKKK
jgi:hypothetical protein